MTSKSQKTCCNNTQTWWHVAWHLSGRYFFKNVSFFLNQSFPATVASHWQFAHPAAPHFNHSLVYRVKNLTYSWARRRQGDDQAEKTVITLHGCHQQTIIMTCSQSVRCSDADKCFRSADKMTVFTAAGFSGAFHREHTFTSIWGGGGLIKGFSIIFAIVLSLSAFPLNLGQGWNLSSSPMDRDGGDYSTDKISAALISEDTKRPASSSPVALTLPEWELLAGVLIPRVVSPSSHRDKEKVTHAQNIISGHNPPKPAPSMLIRWNFRITANICGILCSLAPRLNPLFQRLNPTVPRFNQSFLNISFEPEKRFSSLAKGRQPAPCLKCFWAMSWKIKLEIFVVFSSPARDQKCFCELQKRSQWPLFLDFGAHFSVLKSSFYQRLVKIIAL